MATLQSLENAVENECQVEDSAQNQGQSQEILTPRIASRPKNDGGGYDCEFVDPPPKVLQTECSICLQILREPHIISCCGHNFCRLCIERIQKVGKSCPLCNEPSFTLMHNKGLQRTLGEFHVRCTHQKAGCQWTGELGKLDQHLNVNPEPEKQLEGCSFAEVECLHCHENLPRRFIKDHQEEQCSKRPYSCDYCREYSSTFEDVEANHWPVCPCYFVSCPNECSWPHIIKRQNLDHHLAKECPLQVVDCDFHYAGCEVRLPRSDMPQHLTENFTHISLLATLNQKLANQLLEKDKQNVQLTMELQTQVEMLKEENQILKHEFAQETQALKDQLVKQGQAANAQLTMELQQLTKKMEALDQSVTKLRGKQTRQQQNTEAKISHLEQEQGRMKREEEGLKREMELNQKKIDRRFDTLPVQIRMTAFAQHKRNSDDWYSEPFYSHLGGYKMCLRIFANDGGTHVSVFVSLMRGKYDNSLKWPFRGDVIVQLLNQLEDNEHRTETIRFTDRTPDTVAGRVTKRERAESGWGNRKFIPHTELYKYLRNDRLCFRVSRVDLK